MLLTLAMSSALLGGWFDSDAPNPEPVKDLRSCYLERALPQRDADAMAVAQRICEAAFRSPIESLVFADPNTGACTEYWLDRRGRYETREQYCALEAGKEKNQWTFACQSKGSPANYTLIAFKSVPGSGKLETLGKVLGSPLGRPFASMSKCIGQRGKR